mmetsp:Transcript_105903/g.299562  ORF Transcript_105903/g.299562 Transcript_105903/m.299562 type:complete len:80 (+) Transcript_105903:350-589(+)
MRFHAGCMPPSSSHSSSLVSHCKYALSSKLRHVEDDPDDDDVRAQRPNAEGVQDSSPSVAAVDAYEMQRSLARLSLLGS